MVISGVISQNENVGRAATSERVVLDMRRKDRRIPMKVLVAKTFKFVDHIWLSYVRNRRQLMGKLSHL